MTVIIVEKVYIYNKTKCIIYFLLNVVWSLHVKNVLLLKLQQLSPECLQNCRFCLGLRINTSHSDDEP